MWRWRGWFCSAACSSRRARCQLPVETEPEVGDEAPTLSVADDDIDEPTEAPAEAGDENRPSDLGERATFELTLCIELALDTREVREALCRSLPTNEKRNACWQHVHDNAIEWINWCVGEFDV